jgi:phenylalanyl-tRNA synthetase beta chain
VQRSLEDAAGELLDRCTLFDVFTGGALPAGRKNLAFALEFRAPDRTLSDEDVEPAIVAIADRIRRDFGGELRA